MTSFSRGIAVLSLLMGGSICALAGDITWTLSDVAFDNGNVANGWFTTNPGVTQYDSFSITVTGPDTLADFTATQMVDSYLPNLIGFGNADFSAYVALILASPLTGAGGPVDMATGFDCPTDSSRCGVLIVNSDHTPAAEGVVSPEPSAILLVAGGLGLLGFTLRRKLVRGI